MELILINEKKDSSSESQKEKKISIITIFSLKIKKVATSVHRLDSSTFFFFHFLFNMKSS